MWIFGNWVDEQLDEVQDEFMDSETRSRKQMINRAMSVRLDQILNWSEEDAPVVDPRVKKEVPGSKVVVVEDDVKGRFADPAAVYARLKAEREAAANV